MSVHNGVPWVRDAVASVLAQTAGDLELIVIDGGPTVPTREIRARARDPRVRVEHQTRAGLTRALNHALALARAPLAARLDADDLALPERLERQLTFLAAHAEVGLLGTGAREVDEGGREVAVIRPPADDGALRRMLIRRNPFVHSSVVMRRSVVERAGGDDERLPVAQDYDLWMRMSRLAGLANLPEPLAVRRLLPGRVTAVRDAGRPRPGTRLRWRGGRGGADPRGCAGFAPRPGAALAPPRAPRARARRGV